MKCIGTSLASRRYLRRILVTGMAYIGVIYFTVSFNKHYHPAGVLEYVMAVLPALPILCMLAVAGMYLTEESDEYQRMVTVQSMLWAIGLTLATLTVWGFLEAFAGVRHFQPHLAYPMFWVFVVVVSPFVRLRYR